MEQSSPTTVAIVAGCLALLGWWLVAYLAAWRRSWYARRRARIAKAGELDAVALLARCGYAVVAGQTRHAVNYVVNRVPQHAVLQCDYVVTRGGELFIAEVKTGEIATRLQTAATRRQLLEYQVAFAVPGIVLVDMARGACAEIRFALPREVAADSR